MHFCLEYTVYKAVLFRYLSDPTIIGFSLQWFGMTCACPWMHNEFVQQFYDLFETCGLAPFEFGKIGFGFG